jgi:hypothetical protein
MVTAPLTTDFSLTPRIGHSIEIIDIAFTGGSISQSMDIIIGGEKMLFNPMGSGVNAVNLPPTVNLNQYGLFTRIRQVFPSVPLLKVGEGETLTVVKQSSGMQLYIWYRELTGEDMVLSTMPGGSLNDNRLYVASHYQTLSFNANEEKFLTCNTTNNPAGYPLFPFGGVVPLNLEYDLLGVIASVTTDQYAYVTSGLRVWKQQESILSKEQDYTDFNFLRPLKQDEARILSLLPAPITFKGNENMIVEADIKASAHNTIGDLSVVMIFLQRPK